MFRIQNKVILEGFSKIKVLGYNNFRVQKIVIFEINVLMYYLPTLKVKEFYTTIKGKIKKYPLKLIE